MEIGKDMGTNLLLRRPVFSTFWLMTVYLKNPAACMV